MREKVITKQAELEYLKQKRDELLNETIVDQIQVEIITEKIWAILNDS